ncbi:Flp family type IVb pilin [Mesorhizobium sp. B1-1-5]|uniref:Flp family type IVb pilin n=1 Tax=Mesorhizobium sp. B1-1-5 TaxID=2589979 RepID=UPI0011285107|nr:Flp family type IVb pilin [Mesorhizobium sp. B1-1-5]TPO11084.1 Flp family type IVb pilin [Mesorhizobium sp. B1-1-5]
MKKLMTMTRQFRDDENGAAMVEYTILLGLIAAATIATIVLVATWITGTWSALCTTLDTNSTVACG